MKRILIFTSLTLCATLLALSCDGGGNTCAKLASKLRGCGLLSAGSYDCGDMPDDAVIRCSYSCLLDASCSDVEGLMCGEGQVSGTMASCYYDCVNKYGFRCKDGSQTILPDFRCDADEDCSDGSDETGCNNFECTDGTEIIPRDEVCDGWRDCFDESDEQNCPTWECVNGTSINAALRCNGGTDCSDSSDELGCPGYVPCDEGSNEIPPDDVCDGNNDCTDGSDEVDCPDRAELTCRG